MDATASYDYTKETYTKSADGDTGQRGWIVDGANSASAAITARPHQDHPPIAQINEGWPENGAMKCRSINLTRTAPMTYEISAMYGIPPGGSWSGVGTESGGLVNTKPQISWSNGTISIPTDIDVGGFAITTATGDVIDPPLQRNLTVKNLSIVRWEQGFDYDRYRLYEDTINSLDIKVGRTMFLAGEVWLESINPAAAYEPGTNEIPIQFNFAIIREYRLIRGELKRLRHPWRQLNAYKNAGLTAWASVNGQPKKGYLYWADGSGRVEVPQPYDEQGRPFNKDLRVGFSDDGPMYTPVELASPIRSDRISPYSVEGKLIIIEPEMKRETDHNQLGIFNIR